MTIIYYFVSIPVDCCGTFCTIFYSLFPERKFAMKIANKAVQAPIQRIVPFPSRDHNRKGMVACAVFNDMLSKGEVGLPEVIKRFKSICHLSNYKKHTNFKRSLQIIGSLLDWMMSREGIEFRKSFDRFSYAVGRVRNNGFKELGIEPVIGFFHAQSHLHKLLGAKSFLEDILGAEVFSLTDMVLIETFLIWYVSDDGRALFEKIDEEVDRLARDCP